ncbi:TPA: acyltransferase, partial [Klebsiella pneumoniae]|nr:acyltransferase [Klebsiella pneumoniae]
LRYRADIDGLRAVAILPVLLFHVGYNWFSGGYVGVDVFFVISGYLITSILVNDIKNNTYSILDFYERRIRRIVPALVFVIAFIIVASPFFLPPENYSFLPKEIIGTLLFISNIVSYLKSGYFSTDAEQRPLLHTWSLGIEEQFYIISPVILFIAFKYLKEKTNLLLVILTIISFFMSVFLSQKHPTSSFYLLHTRYWELSFGSLAAVGVFQGSKKQIYREVLSLVGLLMILVAVFSFTPTTIFPSYNALLPVLGATLIILNAEHTTVGKLLSFRPLVFIGGISYSLYLWHWPIIVFANDKYFVDIKLTKEMIVILSVLIAWVSMKYIETPFRNKKTYSRKGIFKYFTVSYFIIACCSLAIWPLNGWSGRLSPQKENILSFTKDISPVRNQCHFNDGVPETSQYCILGQGNKIPHVFVWGDSHGAEIAYALSSLTPLVTATYSACPPAYAFNTESRPDCITHNKKVMNYLLNNKNIKDVVLAANYNLYGSDKDIESFVKGFEKTIELLTRSGKHVIVLDQVPSPGVNVPYTLTNVDVVVNKEFRYNDKVFRKIKLTDGVDLFSYEKYLCAGESCPMMYNNFPISFDDNHLSLSVAKIMVKYIKRDLLLTE